MLFAYPPKINLSPNDLKSNGYPWEKRLQKKYRKKNIVFDSIKPHPSFAFRSPKRSGEDEGGIEPVANSSIHVFRNENYCLNMREVNNKMYFFLPFPSSRCDISS